MNTSERAIIAERIKRVSNTPLEIVQRGPPHINYEIKGLPRTMFDRCWRPSLHKTALLLEANRGTFMKLEVLHNVRNFIKQKHTSVVATQSWSFSLAYYSRTTFSTPIRGHTYLSSFTKSLFSLDNDFYDKTTGELLVHNERRLAFVAGTPFKSIPIPAEGREILRQAGVKEAETRKLDIPHPPCDVYVYQTKPAASDMDQMYHVNQSMYLRYFTDAAYEAGRAGKLPSFPPEKDVAHGRVKDADIVYHAESFPGDVLQVQVWESEPMKLYFVIQKMKNGKNSLVCKGVLTYFSPIDSKL